MKKYISVILFIVMVFGIFACSGNITETKKWVGTYEIDYYSYIEGDQEYLGIDYDSMTEEEKETLIEELKAEGMVFTWEFREDYTFTCTLGNSGVIESIDGTMYELEDRQFDLKSNIEDSETFRIKFSEDYKNFELNFYDYSILFSRV